MRLDLHIHTVASDGDWTPEAVVEAAAESGLDVISVTDHDTVAGVAAAQAAGGKAGVRVVSGTELSATWEGRDIHVLGYGVDPTHPGMAAHDERARRLRAERITAMVERLNREGVEVSTADVVEAAGADAAVLGRPHLALALVARGAVASVDEAFDRLIGDGHPAFIPTDLGPPETAIRTIREAGGVPVWAHPPSDLLESLLSRLVAAGLRGLETYRPTWSGARQRRVSTVARTAGLLRTGGSDWHGPARNGKLGSFWVRGSLIPEFVRELDLRS